MTENFMEKREDRYAQDVVAKRAHELQMLPGKDPTPSTSGLTAPGKRPLNTGD